MTPLEQALRLTCEHLEAGYALVGGLAVSALTVPRTTRDVDLAVRVSDDSQAEDILRRLLAQSFQLSTLLEHDVTHRLVTARLLPPLPGGTLVDLLFACTGIEPEIVDAAQRLEALPGLTLPVARVGHLLAMKLLAQAPERPTDQADLQALGEVCDAVEAARAREACRLIELRGYHRGRDLMGDLANWVPF